MACMGTALTTTQLRLLARVVPEVRLCFDADRAGEDAARRTIEAAKDVPVRLAVVGLPPGSDPGELAGQSSGRQVLAAAVESADPLLPWLVDRRIARSGDSPAEQDRALSDLGTLLEAFPESADKDEAIRRVTACTGSTTSPTMSTRAGWLFGRSFTSASSIFGRCVTSISRASTPV